MPVTKQVRATGTGGTPVQVNREVHLNLMWRHVANVPVTKQVFRGEHLKLTTQFQVRREEHLNLMHGGGPAARIGRKSVAI